MICLQCAFEPHCHQPFLPSTSSLSYLAVVAFFTSSPPCCWAHILVGLEDSLLASEWIFRSSRTEGECWNKEASRGFQSYSDLALELAVSRDAA